MKHPIIERLPRESALIFQWIEQGLWSSLEDVDIAISDGLAVIRRGTMDPEARQWMTAYLLLYRCLTSLRRDGHLTDVEMTILEEARAAYGNDAVLTHMIWVIETAPAPTADSSAEAIDRASRADSLGAEQLTFDLLEHAYRFAGRFRPTAGLAVLIQQIHQQLHGRNRPLQLMMELAELVQVASVTDDADHLRTELDRLHPEVVGHLRLEAIEHFGRALIATITHDAATIRDYIHNAVSSARSYGGVESLLFVLLNSTMMLRGTGDFVAAIRYGMEGMRLAERHHLQVQRVMLGNALTWAYDEAGFPDIALETALATRDRARAHSLKHFEFEIQLVLGKIYSRLGRMDEALEAFDMAFDLAEFTSNYEKPRAVVRTYKGHALTRAERASEALPILLEALAELTTSHADESSVAYWRLLDISNVRWALARSHRLLGEYSKAIEHYEYVLESPAASASDESVDVYLELADCYTQIGDTERALRAYQQYVEARRKADSTDHQRVIARQEIERAIEHERQQAEREHQLLHAILPSSIADRRLNGERRIADTIDDVVVLFIDIAGFTPKAQHLSAHQLIDYLEQLFDPIEAVVTKHGGEKIKTIGDAFMAACGATSNVDRRAERMVRAALEIADLHGNDIRIGVNCGQVVAGVLGEGRFTFDLWGDAVNTAARMEEYGEPGRVHVTEAIARQIDGINDLRIESRGAIDIKGKGLMQTYWVTQV